MGDSEPSEKGSLGFLVGVRVPLAWISVAADPEFGCAEWLVSTFLFDAAGVLVQPAEQVGDPNLTGKLINQNVLLAFVGIPPLGAWVFDVASLRCLIPSFVGLAGASGSPIDVAHSARARSCDGVVFLDAFDRMVVPDEDIRRDGLQLSRNS